MTLSFHHEQLPCGCPACFVWQWFLTFFDIKTSVNEIALVDEHTVFGSEIVQHVLFVHACGDKKFHDGNTPFVLNVVPFDPWESDIGQGCLGFGNYWDG